LPSFLTRGIPSPIPQRAQIRIIGLIGSDEKPHEVAIEFLVNVSGLYSYLAARMGVPLERRAPREQIAAPPKQGLSGLVSSGANMVSGFFGRLLGKEPKIEPKKAQLIAELSGGESSDDESDMEDGSRTVTQLAGRFGDAFRARMRHRRGRGRAQGTEAVQRQLERDIEREREAKREAMAVAADAVVLSWSELLSLVVKEETLEAVRVLLDRWGQCRDDSGFVCCFFW
jgi:hypothetical protein